MRSHRHCMAPDCSRSPRIMNPPEGCLMPSSAPPGSLDASRMVIRLPSMCPSRIRNAAVASEAMPAPTIYADFSSTPFGLRGRANASKLPLLWYISVSCMSGSKGCMPLGGGRSQFESHSDRVGVFFCRRDSAARAEAVDLGRVKAEFLQDQVRVFAQARGDARGHLGGFLDRYRAVHRVLRRWAPVGDRDDDVVREQLWVFDDLFGDLNDAVRQAGGVETFLPVLQRLRGKDTIELGDQCGGVNASTLAIGKARVGRQIRAVDRFGKDRPVLIGFDKCQQQPASIGCLIARPGERIPRPGAVEFTRELRPR